MEEIDWIEAEGDYMKFHVAGRAHLMRETMARLEARLDPKRFIRIHRSTIANFYLTAETQPFVRRRICRDFARRHEVETEPRLS